MCGDRGGGGAGGKGRLYSTNIGVGIGTSMRVAAASYHRVITWPKYSLHQFKGSEEGWGECEDNLAIRFFPVGFLVNGPFTYSETACGSVKPFIGD